MTSQITTTEAFVLKDVPWLKLRGHGIKSNKVGNTNFWNGQQSQIREKKGKRIIK